MHCSNGGGQGLPAHNSQGCGNPAMDSFQQRYGEDIYDERDDGDYEDGGDDVSDVMSRLTMEEDDLTFASKSFAGVRSTVRGSSNRSVSGRSSVSFGRTPSVAGQRPAGILRNQVPQPQHSIATPPRSQVVARTTDVQKFFGGTFAIWVVELWFDNVPRKRCSIHLHILSCASAQLMAQ